MYNNSKLVSNSEFSKAHIALLVSTTSNQRLPTPSPTSRRGIASIAHNTCAML
jgi:hypothetical protein